MEHEQSFKAFYHLDEDREKFYSAFIECVKKFGCGYVAYIYEDVSNKARLGFTTNPDWQKEFVGNHIIDECHLWNAVSEHFVNTQTNNFILRWEDAKAKSSHQKDIILYRMEHGIGPNGISFCTKFNNVREYLAFAPEKNDPDFLSHLAPHMDLIRKYCSLFRRTSHNYLEGLPISQLTNNGEQLKC